MILPIVNLKLWRRHRHKLSTPIVRSLSSEEPKTRKRKTEVNKFPAPRMFDVMIRNSGSGEEGGTETSFPCPYNSVLTSLSLQCIRNWVPVSPTRKCELESIDFPNNVARVSSSLQYKVSCLDCRVICGLRLVFSALSCVASVLSRVNHVSSPDYQVSLLDYNVSSVDYNLSSVDYAAVLYIHCVSVRACVREYTL